MANGRFCQTLSSLLILLSAVNGGLAQFSDFLNFQSDHQSIRCIGVQCPPDRPRCIVEGHLTKCTEAPPPGSPNTKRLSRAPRPLPSDRTPPSLSDFVPRQDTNSISRAVITTPSSSNGNIENIPSNTNIPRSRGAQNGIPNQQNPNNGGVGIPSDCLQAMDPGDCSGYFPRYFYNHRSGQCESFTFGGCGGNPNNFKRFQDCFSACTLPAEASKRGNQQQSNIQNNNIDAIQNPTVNTNVFFSQGQMSNGIRPTQNTNVKSNKGFPSPFPPSFNGFAPGAPPPPPRACTQRVDPGPCEAAIQRYFYNTVTARCELFAYGGCQGNENNFETRDECRRTCDYYDDYINTQTSGRNSDVPPFNTGSKTSFPSSGNNRQSSGNSKMGFDSQQTACLLPPSSGQCLGFFPRYYYNMATKQCQQFTFGGCGGNQNNFQNIHECRKVCEIADNKDVSALNMNKPTAPSTTSTDKVSPVPVRPSGFAPGAPPPAPPECSLRPNSGPCGSNVQRYFYNQSTKQCQLFRYGGCNGNSNNFKTLGQCRQTCDYFDQYMNRQNEFDLTQTQSSSTNTGRFPPNLSILELPSSSDRQPNIPDVTGNDRSPSASNLACNLPPKTGPCRALFRRYYFNRSTGTCERFNYGGCQPNENNFMTQEDCKRICGGNTAGQNRPTRPAPSGPVFSPLSPLNTDFSLFSGQSNSSPFMRFPLSQGGNFNLKR